MNKNIVKLIAILVMCFVIGAVLVACEGPQGPQGEPGKDGAASTVPGPQGPAGEDGKDATLTVDADGYIWANGVNTGIKVDISEENEICDDEHQFVAETWKEHTISSKGIDIAFCVDCGYAEWQVVDHVYDVTKTTPAKCGVDGKVEYFCECGLINEALTQVIEAESHDIPAFDVANPTANGWTLVEDNLVTNVCMNQDVYRHQCTKCGFKQEEKTPALGHDWGEWKLAEENNQDICPCENQNVYGRTCNRCGIKDEQTKKDPATGHTYGAWEKNVDPTVAAKGSLIKYCTVCKHTGCYETKELPVLNATDYATASTGTECEGVATTYTYTVDGLTFEYKTTTSGKGHTYAAKYDVKTVPTTENEGVIIATCSECGATKEVTIPALNTVDYTFTPGDCDTRDSYKKVVTVGTTDITVVFEIAGAYNHEPWNGVDETRIVEGEFYIYTIYMCEECGTWVKLSAVPKA